MTNKEIQMILEQNRRVVQESQREFNKSLECIKTAQRKIKNLL